MKKLLISLFVLGLLLAGGGLVYALFFLEEEAAPTAGQPGSLPGVIESDKQPQIDTRKKGDTPADIQASLDYEIRQNRDTVGWLLVPGTKINDSVLQSHDNSYYLRRDERRKDAMYGCYFADHECSIGGREILSPNTIIYGHSDLKDNPEGPRFSELFRFTDAEFAKKHPVIQFSTPDAIMNWEIFAVCYSGFDMDFYYAEPRGGIEQLAQQAMERSLYDYGVSVGKDDHILTLSTCTVKFGPTDTDHRFLVMARLLPEEGPIPQEAQLSVKNPQE